MRWSVLLLLTFTLPCLGSNGSENAHSSPSAAELEDAERRTGAELKARISDLERMVNTLQRLSQEQNEYIQMLKRRLDALRDEEGAGS